MNIHISALIQKMEEELKKAKTAERDEELKRYVAVVRSLCDVVLDQPETASAPAYSRALRQVLPAAIDRPADDGKNDGERGIKQISKARKREAGRGRKRRVFI